MNRSSDKAPTPADIEARQDAVLRQLEELERRIVQVLAEHGVAVELSAPGTISLQVASTGPLLANPLFADVADPNVVGPDAAGGGGRQSAAA